MITYRIAQSFSIVLLLSVTGCGASSGELSRSKAKALLLQAQEAKGLYCDPCFVDVVAWDQYAPKGQQPFADALLEQGYVEPFFFAGGKKYLMITDRGRSFFGPRFIEGSYGKSDIHFGLFKREFGEITGISMSSSPNRASAEFTIKVTPATDMVRDSRIGIDGLCHCNRKSLEGLHAVVQEDAGKLKYFLIPELATFQKYDDGWRLDPFGNQDHRLGGLPGDVVSK